MAGPVIPERRAYPRHWYRNGRLPPSARLRPGRDVTIVNLSEGGALIEGNCRVRPGARVELHLQVGSWVRVVSGFAHRCFVHMLPINEPVRYRAAVRFAVPAADLPGPDPVAAYIGGDQDSVSKKLPEGTRGGGATGTDLCRATT